VTYLLDSNVLVALVQEAHVHAERAGVWLEGMDQRFATCPITQGALLRLLVRSGVSTGDARASLESAVGDLRHEFWPDARHPGPGARRSAGSSVGIEQQSC